MTSWGEENPLPYCKKYVEETVEPERCTVEYGEKTNSVYTISTCHMEVSFCMNDGILTFDDNGNINIKINDLAYLKITADSKIDTN